MKIVHSLIIVLVAFVLGCQPAKPQKKQTGGAVLSPTPVPKAALKAALEEPGEQGPAAAGEATPSAEGAPTDEQAAMMDTLWSDMYKLFSEGKTNDVIALLEKTMADEEFAQHKPVLFREFLNVLINSGNLARAQQEYLKAVDQSPDLAADTFGVIESSLSGTGKHAELVPWCEKLLEKGLPERLRPALFATIMDSLRAQNDIDGLLTWLPRCMKDLTPQDAQGIVSGMFNAVLQAGRFDDLTRLLDFVEKTFADNADLQQTAKATRCSALIRQGKLPEAGALLESSLGALSDSDAARLLDEFVRAAVKAKNPALAEALCSKAIEGKNVESRLYRSAAYQWVGLPQAAGNVELTRTRLMTVVDQGATVSTVVQILNRAFYSIMEKDDKTVREAMMNLCDAQLAKATADYDKASLLTMMLDASFMLQDFDRALRILGQEIPFRDEKWRAMLIPKVKAHKALAAGNKPEAIKFFREFMDHVARSEESVTDPVTAERVPREMILGLNAVRIGDLWGSLNETKKAAAAYDEARDYYRKAMSAAKEGSEEYKKAKDKLDTVPTVDKTAAVKPPEDSSAK
jgi:tetratricopeptide (TPR) repeat protein